MQRYLLPYLVRNIKYKLKLLKLSLRHLTNRPKWDTSCLSELITQKLDL